MSIGMCLFLIVLLFCICYKMRVNDSNEYFMSKEYSNVLKGIMSIIVVLVHIPLQYSNKIQDAIGSFGYICVTMFFIFSAYGLMYSLDNKKDYIKNFLKQRLLIILIPFFIVNTISLIILKEWNNGIVDMIKVILGVKSITFITVLIIFYIIFYIICKFVNNIKIRRWLLVVFPIIYSIGCYMFQIHTWPVEALGFTYGILIYINFKSIKKYINENFKIKLIISMFVSLIVGILYLKYKEIWLIGEYFIKIILGISIIWFICQVTQKIKINNKILSFLGNISYEVYLLHGLVISLLLKTTINSSDIFIWLTIIGTILSASILNRLDKAIINKIKKGDKNEREKA